MAHHTDNRRGIAYPTVGRLRTSRQRHLTFFASASNYGHAHKSVSSMEPWRAKLDESDSVAAWDLFIEQYRRLIFATIKQLARDHDDILDVFTRVCEALRADDLARLRRYTDSAGQRARFSTWLVTVVRNQAIDWLRQRDGRPRSKPPSSLSPIQKQIFEHVTNGRSHVETYEMISARASSPMPFGSFLKEVNKTYRVVEASHRIITRAQTATAAVALDDIAMPSVGGSEGANRSSARVTAFRRPIGGSALHCRRDAGRRGGAHRGMAERQSGL